MAHRDLIVAVMLSICLIASSVQGSTTKVTYCDKKANYDVKVKGLEITPYPVARGQPATFSILATTGEALSGGKVLIEVSLFGVHIHSETHELCSETSCPVSAGDFVIAHSQVLPGYTPPMASVPLLRKDFFHQSKNLQLQPMRFRSRLRKISMQAGDDNLSILNSRMLNDHRLMLAERGFLDSEGLLERHWFKHWLVSCRMVVSTLISSVAAIFLRRYKKTS